MSARRRPAQASPAAPKNERVAAPERVSQGGDAAKEPARGAGSGALRARLRRAATLALRVLAVVGVVIGAVQLGRALETFVRTSPAFALEEIVVRGATRMSDEEIVGVSGIARGENVFLWPPEEVEARLRAHPWIDRVSVRRKLPGRFEIEVREHTPRALLVLDAHYLVSREGVVFKEVGPGEHFDLPLVTRAAPEAVRADRDRRAALLAEVAALLHDVEAAEPSWANTLAEVHVERDGAFTLRFGDEGVEVRLGRGDVDGKLARLRRVFARLEQAGVEASVVYADNERRPDRVTVELRSGPQPN